MSQANPDQPNNVKKIFVLLIVLLAAIAGYFLLRQFLDLDFLAARESAIKQYYLDHPVIVLGVAFLIYFIVTGLSIPGATIMSLLYAWFFGFPVSLVLISFASTAGATMAFMLSRYLFQDWIHQKFGERLTTFNQALDREGAFYLFSLRLVPLVPFFVINAVMGLTRIRVTTFWWVSQLGMLAGTAVYCYAGSRIPDLQTIQDKGIAAVFNANQLTQITIAFVLLGLFPLIAKKVLGHKRPGE